ncbi:MAG TPA: nuclear transport factor 2 family protein [Polyangium sp.]|jgi:ketosteroid isomerase-like protein|nr:nuclear transport factor 2 family protein [Polyangium sp.]
MHAHEQLIETFYKAFQQRDAEAMAACYHKDVVFSDPVFPDLHGARAGNMWRMLCARGKDLKIEFSGVSANDSTGKAHWEAWYTFSGTGRKVHNIIDAEFEFRDGKIVRHKDQFNFWRWSRQAIGPAGVLLGWTPILLNGVRKKADKGLVDFEAKKAG